MPEKLRLIADCIEQGKSVQSREICAPTATPKNWSNDYNITNNPLYDIAVYAMSNYRAKPDKPRTGTWNGSRCRCYGYEAIELTEEVKKALQDANIDYG